MDDDDLKIKVELGMKASSTPTFRELQDRARQRLGVVAAGQADLAFLDDEDLILDLNVVVKDDEISVLAKVPKAQRQVPLIPPKRPRRGARLRREEDPIDQKLVDAIGQAVQTSADSYRAVAEVGNTCGAAQIRQSTRNLERQCGVDTAPLRAHIAAGADPFKAEIAGQYQIAFDLPTTVRRTVVAQDPSALYILPSARRSHLDLPGYIRRKVRMPSATPPAEDPKDRFPADQFDLHYTYSFRFTELLPVQHAVLAAAWALEKPVGLVARYAISCCTLKSAPAEVDEVIDWQALVEAVADAIRSADAFPIRGPKVAEQS